MLKIPVFILLALYSLQVSALELREDAAWQALFDKNDIRGVFVLCELGESHCRTNNIARANKQYIPASTFKIPHTLIALETGVVENGRQVFHWNNEPRAYEVWEQDFNLHGAMQNSVVPIYQQFARAIGETDMQRYLELIAYGNADIHGGIDRFWLDGNLKISALEQIEFLHALYNDELPFTKRNQLIVKDALLAEANARYILRAKTGYSLGMPGYGSSSRPGTGWWTGWIEKGTEVHFFAANFDIEQDSQLLYRKQLLKEILHSEGILPDL